MRQLIASALAVVSAISAFAQTDTVVTRLREVAVVGVKQTAASDLAPVTVVSERMLDRLDAFTVKSASQLAPNIYMPDYGSRMTSSIYVRGLGARMDQPVVGLNVDNVPYLNKDNYDFDLFDIERVEFLRGSQSVLNGRNTMAGQVNVTTLSPWRFQGVRAMAEYGRANSVKAGVGYYTRLSHSWATSVNAYYTGTDGFYANEHTGSLLDHERQGSMRWKLSWHPSSRLTFTNVASGQVSRQGGYPYMFLNTGSIAYNDTCFYRRNTLADGLTVGWTGKRVVVTSVTSLQYLDDNMTLDQDFLPQPYFTLTQRRKELSATEDLYAKGHRGRLHWLGGVFGFSKRTDMSAPVTFKDDGIANLIEKHPNQMNPQYPIRWDERSFVLGSDFLTMTRGAAVYGQATYESGPWTVDLGLRLDAEHVAMDYTSACNTAYTTYHAGVVYSHDRIDIDDRGRLSHTYVQLLPRVAVGYDAADALQLFADVSKGYKAGGFNTQMFSDVLQQKIMGIFGIQGNYNVDEIVSYKPEKSWTAELGARFSPDAPLHADLTLFYIRCTDQQLTAFPKGMTTGRIMTNAGRTRSFGAELSVTFNPVSALTLSGSYGYTNARFIEYRSGKDDFAGKRLPYAPQSTLFLMADYSLPFSLAAFKPSVCVSTRGVGDIYWDDANLVRQPFYATLGASAALDNGRWQLRLWAENITGTRYSTFYFVSMGNAFVQRARPCTYGVTLRATL